jgi:hypothetical protein
VFGFVRFVRNLFSLNKRLAENSLQQAEEGYKIEFTNIGPERYITYSENGREIDIIADFTILNDVVLYTVSLRHWDNPKREELTSFDYQKVMNRVIRYLSCWGNVTLDGSELRRNEDLEKSLEQQGIDFVVLKDGTIKYEIDLDKK